MIEVSFNDKPVRGSWDTLPELRLKECYIHGFKTHSDILLDQHFRSIPHYAMGRNGICENCKETIDKFLIPYKTIGEPAHILCDNCKDKMNKSLETLQDTKLFNSCFPKDG